ncbi:hypothetical protein M406DRAFT_326951 [Cryphonectria parasitica EP155]|uniref:Uncharacterized protein n=1 Tax=Cryphonectria parasitica (strain ATCC 38755 / EP155) TaxID=660469 RepID=A0A9P5CRF4_CRYP1|nr:uncharacterized protein M406DRAFT_326951 [Cryphonectria parasitica EP155]KAF3768514.1 hypothetical protein M406DRAFT_326951 [Cryphonectria parasitica EP155]
MPGIGRVNTWLSSGGGGGSSATVAPAPIESLPSDFLPSSSPNGMSPITTNIRVSGGVLENLRLIVCNFPDLSLTTSCLTIQTIRSYARKLRRGDLIHDRVPACRLQEEQTRATIRSPTSPELRTHLNRKKSLGNLKLINSLRGKFSNRFGHSATSATLQGNGGDHLWGPPAADDPHAVTLGFDSLPSDPVETEVEACVDALRVIFPDGTNYLLDLLYAHIIAYNYMNSLLGGLAPLKLHSSGGGGNGNGGFPPLNTKPSMKLPAGVTSLADLQMHPDSSETVIHDFHHNVATVASRVTVPSKAAATLGLGCTDFCNGPFAPAPGPRGGGGGGDLHAKLPLKNSPTATSFTQSLESEQAMRHLRDDIALNIYRLVEMTKSCSRGQICRSHEEQNAILSITDGNVLDPMFMRAMCEVVRCYEELLA